MQVSDIRAGKFYVWKNSTVRQVVGSTASKVYWRDFSLVDGRPFGSGTCSIGHFAQNIARAALGEEIARLQLDEADAKETERMQALVYAGLRAASDEMLLEEVQRRGLL